MPKNTKTEKVVAEAKVPEVTKEEPKVEAKPTDKKVKAQKAGAVEKPQEAKVEAKVEPKVEAKPKVSEPKTTHNKEETTETAQEGGKRRVRYFRCIYSDDTFGRFSGFKPKQAAGKALTSILRHREKEGKNLFEDVSFSMIECTRGGNHKVSQYTGKRVKLEKPVTVTIKTSDGKKKEINYNFTNKITKVKGEKKTTEKKVSKKVATKKVASKKTTTKKSAKKTPAKKVSTKKVSTKKADA